MVICAFVSNQAWLPQLVLPLWTVGHVAGILVSKKKSYTRELILIHMQLFFLFFFKKA